MIELCVHIAETTALHLPLLIVELNALRTHVCMLHCKSGGRKAYSSVLSFVATLGAADTTEGSRIMDPSLRRVPPVPRSELVLSREKI
jgi:hypothetical protein